MDIVESNRGNAKVVEVDVEWIKFVFGDMKGKFC